MMEICRKKDLSTPTAYNTYVINWLAADTELLCLRSSIKTPSGTLIRRTSRYLYFVASGDSGHVFSKIIA